MTNVRLYCCLACLILSTYCNAQRKGYDIRKTYSVEEILKDIDYTEKYLLKFHPDPYRYISKDSLHAFVMATRLKITRPLTESQVRLYLRQIVAKIGCGHTDVLASKPYVKRWQRLTDPFCH